MSSRTLHFRDRPLMERERVMGRGVGRHLVQEDVGAQIYAVVQNGKLVGYEAERDGKALEVLEVRARGTC